MSYNLFYLALSAFGLIISPLLYIWKQSMAKIYQLEEEQKKLMSKEEARLLVQDKIDPISTELRDIKVDMNARLDKLLDYIINQKE